MDKNWIQEYGKASFLLYAGNTIDAFQPLDFFHFYPLWYDLWVKRFMMVMDVLDLDFKPYKEVKHLLPGPSSMRAILQKIIPTAKGLEGKNKEQFARMANFFARMLIEACPQDPFGLTSNPIHEAGNAQKIITSTPWHQANPTYAKQLGQLITAAGSLVHGLYNDVVTDFGWDAYGPYSFATPDHTYQMVIRHFPNLAPIEIWEKELLTPIKDLQIYQFYQNVTWEFAFLGCHTVLKKGDPIQNLTHFAVKINGNFIHPSTLIPIIQELAGKAEQIYANIRKKNPDEIKRMVMLQECFQLQKLFTAAYLNWLPTPEMYERIQQPLRTGILPFGKIMTSVEEYQELFHLNWFEKNILN